MSNSADVNNLKIYGRLLGYLRPHLGSFALSILGYLLLAITQPLLAYLLGYVIDALQGDAGTKASRTDNALAEGSMTSIVDDPFSYLADKFDMHLDWLPSVGDISLSNQLHLIPVFVVFIYLTRGIGLFLGNYGIARVSENVIHTLRTQVFNKLTVMPGTFFDLYSSGELISKITYNVAQVTVAVTDALKIYLREGLQVLALFLVLIIISWKLTLVFAVVAPFIALIVSAAGKRMRRISGKVQTAMGNITSIASEMINGYRIMRIFGGEDYENERFTSVSRYTRNQNIKISITQSLAAALNQFFVAVALGILMYIALFLLNPDGASDVLVYMLMIGMLPKPLRQISDVYGKVQRALVAARSIFEQIDETPENDVGTFESDHVAGKIEFVNVSFTYPGTVEPALQEISLSVEPGTTVALVGRSGSGKSTLVSLIPRYYDHRDGSILLDGREINDYTLKNLRHHVALVTQNVVLFNDTVANNIAYGELAGKTRDEIAQAARNAHATEFIEELASGFDTQIGEDGMRLSGGQRQRLAIARAFLKNAPILIMDEATSALDTESERLIQDALEHVIKNRTTFIIAHRLSTVEKADKIVVLRDGRIVEVGNHEELIRKNGHYAALYAMQFKEDDASSDVVVSES